MASLTALLGLGLARGEQTFFCNRIASTRNTIGGYVFLGGFYRLRCTSLEDLILLDAEIRQRSPRSTQILPAIAEDLASK